MGSLSLGCKSLDELLNGGLPIGAPSLIYGIPNLGKTWFCYQAACACTRSTQFGGLDRPVLYLDTESFFTPDVAERFYNYYRLRWPDLPKESRIEIIRIPDLFALGSLFGMQFTIVQEEARVSALVKFPTKRQTQIARSQTKKGTKDSAEVKQTHQNSDWLEQSEAWLKFQEKNYGLMVIDSITVPIKAVVPKGTQHLPGRGTLLNAILGILYPFAITFNSGVLVTNHITRSPLSPTYSVGYGEPWGGQDIVYFIKYQIGLYPPLKADRENNIDGKQVRRVSRHRYPGLEEKLVTVKLATDRGYVDLDEGAVRKA